MTTLGERLRAITEQYPMPVVFCRIRGGRTHTGVLHSSHGSEGVFARVRDSKRGSRSQYQGVFQRHLEAGVFEVKVGSRYVPFDDEVADSLFLYTEPEPSDEEIDAFEASEAERKSDA